MIRLNQPPVEGITGLSGYFPTDPESHQDWNNDDGQRGRTCHGIRFREGQWPEQAPFLPFQGKNRNERQGDDQQADKQRRPYFHGSIGDDLPAGGVIYLLARMLMVPLFQPFMRVFNHDDGRIHHRPDGNRDPPQRHNIGVQALEVHDNKGDAQAKRQRNNRHQC